MGEPEARHPSSEFTISGEHPLEAAALAHDFNNLLAAIRGTASLGARKCMQPEVQSLFEDIERLVDDASQVTRSLIQATPTRTDDACVNVDQLVADCAQDFERSGGDVRLNAQGPAMPVRADRVQLQRVLLNLLKNAQESCTPGSSVEITTYRAAHRAHIRIGDTGTGMDGDTLAQAFNPYFTTKKTGTGLGLANSREIVLGLGGRITVETVTGEGTSVTLELPLAIDASR